MILTTTPSIEGHTIDSYLGLVYGEVITGVNVIKDIGATFRDLVGGRAQGYENELIEARHQALAELEDRARALGADAVVGCHMDYEVLGQAGSMLMISVCGTAVTLAK